MKQTETNSICERLSKASMREFFPAIFQKRVFDAFEALQADVRDRLSNYNHHIPHL